MTRALVVLVTLASLLPYRPASAQDKSVIDRFWSAAARGDSADVLETVTPGAELFEYHSGWDAFIAMDWAGFPIEYLDLVWGFPGSEFSVDAMATTSTGPFVSREEAITFVGEDGVEHRTSRLATYLIRGGRLARMWLFPERASGPPDFGIAPRFSSDERPTVLIDAAHDNLHKSDGSFRSLAAMASQDGLVVRDLLGTLSEEELDGADLFVVGNALRRFSDGEVELLAEWVESGGSLLLVSDHRPYSEVSAPLATRLGFDPFLGRAVERPRRLPDLFTSAQNSLRFPDGSSPDDVVVATMTGHAFLAPPTAVPLLTLRGDWVGVTEGGEERPLDGWFQGAALPVGSGRVVFLAEARVLADLSLRDNAVFARAILEWLVPGGAG